MKLIYIICFLVCSASAIAKDLPNKIVLHVNDAFKIGHLGKSVKNIRVELGDSVDIKVVVNGNAVTRMLKSNETSSKVISSLLKQNVTVGLCHNAVRNNHVSKEMLIEGVVVLPHDGNVSVMKYQQQGYLYIKL